MAGLDQRACVLQDLLEFKRAGADGALTYFAKDAKRCLKQRLEEESLPGSIKLQQVCADIKAIGI